MEKIVKHLLFFCFCSFNTYADTLNSPCKVVKVTDGDTVYVLELSNAKHKICLGSIDALEKIQAFGQKSKQNLSKLIAGKFIDIEYEKRDG